MIQINDLFHTVQGEGANAGRRALFCRLPKCNLSCSWCDTSFDTSYPLTKDDFRAFAQKETHRFAVVTGGEPLLNKDAPTLIGWLKEMGYEVAVETNGTMPYLTGIDFVTCSPKRDAVYKIHRALRPHVQEFKYVVDEGFDFELLKRHDSDPETVRLSLSPEFGAFDKNIQNIIAFIKENPRWRISLQTHKWINVP